MGLFDNQKVAVAYCTPCPKIKTPSGDWILDTITMNWHRARVALAVPTNFNFIEFFADGMEVGDARQKVALKCLDHNPRPEYLFFLDYDVLPTYDALTKLYFRARTNPDYDVFTGVYCCKRQMPSDPLIYAGDGVGAFWDWAVGDILTTDKHGITGTHMGLTLIRTSLFQRMVDAGVVNDETPFFYTPNERYMEKGCMRTRVGTEDLWFYKLAAKVDVKIMVDTSVLAGHIDKNTGITWGLPPDSPPVLRAEWMRNKDRSEACNECGGSGRMDIGKPLPAGGFDHTCDKCGGTGCVENKDIKLALDIGAGDTRRQWPGYKTYTTDIRPSAKPDYVMDTRLLNLPADHFDLVASSHHFEHIGRWDQEYLWTEVYKVCKPGGKIEIVVPNIEWAANKIMNHELDAHVYNVLYGAQEEHGYEREFNSHYFGYTPEIGKAMAEEAGFTDVTVECYHQNSDLGYNMIIRGTKPVPKDDCPEPVSCCGSSASCLGSSVPFDLPSTASPPLQANEDLCPVCTRYPVGIGDELHDNEIWNSAGFAFTMNCTNCTNGIVNRA